VKTVLVVEDEFGIAELLRDLLSEEGYRVETAFDGKQALTQLARSKPDIVLMDFMMAGMNGADVLKTMAVTPTLKNIPVVMMSSLPETVISEKCTAYAAFLRKPFRVHHVLDTIGRLIGGATGPG
jgi:CheY-like chemotaxis protein